MPKVLILGRSGQVARALQALSWPVGLDVIALGKAELGVQANPAEAAKQAIVDRKPVLVLNAAAFTAVDRAESQEPQARAMNADLPRAIAHACSARNIPLVHVSTDYVFDGAKGAPYLETDAPNPLSVYAATKLDGDRAVQQAPWKGWAILRSSWVISEIGETFPVKILRRAHQGESLRVVDDQLGCPTMASDLAHAMQAIGLRLLDGDSAAAGLFNFCGAAAMTWYALTDRLLRAAEDLGMKRPSLETISSAELNAPARRPAYSILSCDRIRRQCDIVQPGIDTELRRMVSSILAHT